MDHPKINDWFHIIDTKAFPETCVRRKIGAVANNGFGWGKRTRCGIELFRNWKDIKSLEPNSDKASKVRWIYYK